MAGLCIAAAGAWRLSQGPVSLSYFNNQISSIISDGLGGKRAEISDLVIERDAESGRTSLRMRDLRLFDDNGILIAKAPRAAIGVDISALLTGSVVPRRLELIGPNIKIRRLITGEVKMGFGDADQTLRPASTPPVVSGDAQPDPADAVQPLGEEVVLKAPASGLTHYVKKEFFSKRGGSAASTINAITISNASISLYDQENNSFWRIPSANLAFKKTDFGASLFFDATVASGKKPWKLDLVANYRRSSDGYSVIARISDLVPADLSKKIFMLSQLTQVRLPLSGQVNVEIQGDGKMNSATANLVAAPGVVDFPDFLSSPIVVDKGKLNLVWDPKFKALQLTNSSAHIGKTVAKLSGQFQPFWSQTGFLEKIGFTMNARNSASSGPKPQVDRIDITGAAFVEEGRVNVDDLLIMSTDGGLRLRGVFAEGDEALSMRVSGRVQNLPLSLANTMWPPIVAPLARDWMQKNIKAGKLEQGTFHIDLPSHILGPAIREKRPIPDKLIDAKLKFSGVTTAYYAGQPDVQNLSGHIAIRGDSMDLTELTGTIPSEAGGSLQVVSGRMNITELANPISKGDLQVVATSDVSALLELADRPPLKMISGADFNAANASGKAEMSLSLKMPLVPDVPPEQIDISADIKLTSFGLKQAFRNLDLSAGNLDINVNSNGLTASGKIKLDGIPANLTWTRKTWPVDLQAFKLETTLDENLRRKFGLDISRFLTGQVAVKLEGSGKGAKITQARITSDLSRAQLHLHPIHWRYGPKAGTKAVFDIDFSDPNKAQIKGLKISGEQLSVEGSISLKSSGDFLIANLPTVRLGRLNTMGLTASRNDQGALQLDVTGQTFDSRPMIAGLFDEATGQIAPIGDDQTQLKARFETVYAYHDRHVSNVSVVATTSGDALTSMRLDGQFANGAPMNLTIQPRDDGSRDMLLTTSDGGAALRASNLYSKIQGGQLDFKANLGRPGEGTIRRGDLTIRSFVVANERELAQFQQTQETQRATTRQRPQQQTQLIFDKLTLPFAVDRDFVRIGDASVQGPAVGALAKGSIRKADGKLSIGGTLIPAYGLNSAFSNVPLLGAIITGGKDEGVIGLTFGLSGTMNSPQVQINPVSAIAPGFLRKVFEFQGQGALGEEEKKEERKRKRRNAAEDNR
ncbi:MAG: DUF3971 domain-containing protein [Hyphomicrobiales bacterium]